MYIFEISIITIKGEQNIMTKQDKLRKQVKLAKALNDDWSYKSMSEVIGISSHAFYNWLNGFYDFSSIKERQLMDLIDDLIDEY